VGLISLNDLLPTIPNTPGLSCVPKAPGERSFGALRLPQDEKKESALWIWSLVLEVSLEFARPPKPWRGGWVLGI
jgi:hypothetical protein